MRHLIDPTDLTVQETEQIVALAEDIIANRAKYSEACKGKKLATLFYEPSTRYVFYNHFSECNSVF